MTKADVATPKPQAAGAATLKAAQEKEALMAELSALTIAHSGALQGLGEEIVELNSRLLLKDQEVQRLTERVQVSWGPL